MAKPIKETPTLEGVFAKAFYDSVNDNKLDERKEAYLEECREVYRKATAKQK